MLAKYLKNLRASKTVSTPAALQSLGAGWSEVKGGALKKDYVFEDFHEAANFLQRYSDYC